MFGGKLALKSFLSPVFNSNAAESIHDAVINPNSELLLMSITVIGAIIFIYFAWFKFIKKHTIPNAENANRSFIPNLLFRKYYIDELYNMTIVKPVLFLSVFFHKLDVNIIDKFVDGFGSSTLWLGIKVRKLQTGTIGFYLVAMVLSIVAFIIFGLMI
jgi:NADH-quinone oxidoreductase subunit L